MNALDVITALKTRHSTRAFLNKSVDDTTIRTILEAAKCAPSGVNTQPWQVFVLSGAAKNELCGQMEAAFRAGQKPAMDYSYYPNDWQEPYKGRRKACGLAMYATLNITREDKDKQLNQWAQNYQAFGAPVMMLFAIDKVMEKGSYLDYGMFIQSVMLAATALGLATCPQAALAEYPDIARKFLGLDNHKTILCGLALGYEDTNHIINNYRTEREPLQSIATFLQ